jgi:tetratricopeptide (TPR) repeat protein
MVILAAVPAAAESPWARGVDDVRKARAQKLLEEGNDLFVRQRHKEALDRYQEALKSWDHPAIRFNAVRALIALERILEANEYLTKALAYGREPFDEDLYNEALNYQRLLKNQTATIAVTCDQPGVIVEVDGRERIACPSSRSIVVLPGGRRIHASGPGLVPISRDLAVDPGKRTDVAIKLERLVATRAVRRWSAWRPWAVVGAGIAATSVGVAFNVLARSTRSDLDAGVARDCGAAGCSADRYRELGYTELEDRVTSRNATSLVALTVGGAALVTGAVMVLLNRPALRREFVNANVTADRVTFDVRIQF